MKAVRWKFLKSSFQNQIVDKVQFVTFDILTPKSIGIFNSPSCIYV